MFSNQLLSNLRKMSTLQHKIHEFIRKVLGAFFYYHTYKRKELHCDKYIICPFGFSVFCLIQSCVFSLPPPLTSHVLLQARGQLALQQYCTSLFMYCSNTTHVFKNIKNGSHDTIHTFKNYFTIVIFNFNKNKFNPNGPNDSLFPLV